MKRTIKLILFIGTFVLILALIGFIAIKFGQDRLSGEQGASAEYAILRNAVAPITSEQELGDQFVRDRLKSLYSASAHLLAVQVLDRNGLVLWKMPDESPYFASPASNPGSVFRAPGMSTVIYMTPLPDGMKLMALYATLTQADFSRILLLPIIILALWIMLLVVLQITLKEKAESKSFAEMARAGKIEEHAMVEERPEEQNPVQEPELVSEEELPDERHESEMEAIPEEAQLIESDKETTPKEQQAPLSLEPEPESGPSSESELESFSETETQSESRATEAQEVAEPVEEPLAEARKIPEETQGHAPTIEYPRAEEREAQDTRAVFPSEALEEEGEFVTPPPQEAPKSQAQEFFPSTIHSHALEQSLAAELSRNQDVALMLILCELSGDSDPSALALGVTIRDYFATDSLVFELGMGCYAALLPGSDAGSSLKLAVDLDDVLTATASLYKDLAEEPPFYFGMSGRYDRAIEPERLYKEAYAALKHAHESGSRILAFKPAAPTS